MAKPAWLPPITITSSSSLAGTVLMASPESVTRDTVVLTPNTMSHHELTVSQAADSPAVGRLTPQPAPVSPARALPTGTAWPVAADRLRRISIRPRSGPGAQPGGGELDGQRQPVQPPADRHDKRDRPPVNGKASTLRPRRSTNSATALQEPAQSSSSGPGSDSGGTR